MSILGKILGPIWERAKAGPGHKPDRTATPTSAPAPRPTPAPTSAQAQPAPTPAATAPQQVDVDGILDFMNEQRDQKLNWRTSIVDLMKLTGMDSTLDERRELADELGYAGDKSDTAAMNIWLHERVLERIRADGGQIRDLTD
ncbi:DUF3597 domain-containing protein [Brevundimonas fluminis]|jgi:hypothetical protein|uniref:DUF3597 domain-containing protein n=1 Tax=Brevundimonas fluminis TaxID=2487274 RepID=UPI000F657AA7|nr:DUF3597 domain-containing protein [Brevundimonas fluminis]